jgi:indole-3-glycerol phosphate synthase
MNIMEEILAHKKQEVQERKLLYPTKLLEKSIYFDSPTVSMKEYLVNKHKSGVIAEFKRKSPSKGIFNKYIAVEQTSISYMQAGASGLSVLTDEKYFGGKNEDLTTARQYNFCPILRKDFIIDEYQIIEARSIGADAILLIANILDQSALNNLAALAKDCTLEIILEVHTAADLDKINDMVDIVGVNNRDLKTFSTDVNTSFELEPLIPAGITKISESGISEPRIAAKLKQAGFDGFLIGEQFMKNSRPGAACAEFIEQLNQLYESESLRFEGHR